MHICITLCIHAQTRSPLTQYYIISAGRKVPAYCGFALCVSFLEYVDMDQGHLLYSIWSCVMTWKVLDADVMVTGFLPLTRRCGQKQTWRRMSFLLEQFSADCQVTRTFPFYERVWDLVQNLRPIMRFVLAKENPHSTLEAENISTNITLLTGATASNSTGPYLCEWPVNGTKYLSMFGSWLIK
jgi:hypothetical protein